MARKIVRKVGKVPTKKTPVKVTKKPAKKIQKSTGTRSKSIEFTQFFVPSVIAFIVSWFLTRSMGLGSIIFFGVLVGNWFGQTYKNKK